jgi:hypothetical protein
MVRGGVRGGGPWSVVMIVLLIIIIIILLVAVRGGPFSMVSIRFYVVYNVVYGFYMVLCGFHIVLYCLYNMLYGFQTSFIVCVPPFYGCPCFIKSYIVFMGIILFYSVCIRFYIVLI